jgi:hypothetical protein
MSEPATLEPDQEASAVDVSPETPSPWTSDGALTLDDARALTSKRGATVVLILGEIKAGKSSLLVELWTELLIRGHVGGFKIAGTVTALAFEERAFGSRLASGTEIPDTRRTHEEDDGFLHLRLQDKDGHLTELLLADVSGEHFTRIREGVPLEDELYWVSRVDRFLLLVDGAGVANPTSREITLTRSTRLLHALRLSAKAADTSRVAVVLSKEDLLTAEQTEAYDMAEASLLTLAQRVDAGATAWRVAVRPHDHGEPRGLETLVAWFCEADRQMTPQKPLPIRSTRSMGRFQA